MNNWHVAVPCSAFGGTGQPVGWAEGVMVGLLIAGRPMDQVELEAGYLASLAHAGFFVIISPSTHRTAQPAEVTTLFSVARQEKRALFQVGRMIVIALNGAWDSPVLVDKLATVLMRYQMGSPVPGVLPRSRMRRAFQTARSWVRGVMASIDSGNDTAVQLGEGTARVVASVATRADEPVAISVGPDGPEETHDGGRS